VSSSGNTGEVTVQGVELSLRYRPEEHSLVALGYAYADADGWALNQFTPQVTLEELGENVPVNTLSLFAMHRLASGTELSALYYSVGNMKWLGDGDIVDALQRLDLRVAQGIRLPGLELKLALVVQNLLGTYTDFRDENQFDTRVYVELGLNWH